MQGTNAAGRAGYSVPKWSKNTIALGLALFLGLSGVFLYPVPAKAAPVSLFSDSFGSGQINDLPEWEEEGTDSNTDVIATSSVSGADISLAGSPEPNFAKIKEDDEWMCREFDTTGYESVELRYYWNGDSDADAAESDDGVVQYKDSGSSCTGAWTDLATHPLETDTDWSSEQVINLPATLDDDSSFFI